MFAISREISSRREYLDKKSLEKGTERLETEKGIYENALTSALDKDLVGSENGSEKKATKTIIEAVFIVIEMSVLYVDETRTSTEEKLELMSNLIKRAEKMCAFYKLKVIKADSTSIMIVAEPDAQNATNQTLQDIQIEKCIRFCFQMKSILSLHKSPVTKSIDTKIVMDFGQVSYGLIGKHHFVYDCLGEPVTRALQVMRKINHGETCVTDLFRDAMNSVTFAETQHLLKFADKAGRVIKVYRILDKADVWGMYIKNIEWMSGDEEDTNHALPTQSLDDIKFTEIVD